MPSKPVIFLAFANDVVDYARYLTTKIIVFAS